MVVTSHLPEASFFLGPHTAAAASPSSVGAPSVSKDALSAVDALLATYRARQIAREVIRLAHDAEREAFRHEADCALEEIAKPAFEAIVRRMQCEGGGGLVTERAAKDRHGRRMTLWMAPKGSVPGRPRVDRFPYLQIDVDVPTRVFKVWEGDMWNGRGASRPAEAFTLGTLTTQEVTRRAVAVLRRVVALDASDVEPMRLD